MDSSQSLSNQSLFSQQRNWYWWKESNLHKQIHLTYRVLQFLSRSTSRSMASSYSFWVGILTTWCEPITCQKFFIVIPLSTQKKIFRLSFPIGFLAQKFNKINTLFLSFPQKINYENLTNFHNYLDFNSACGASYWLLISMLECLWYLRSQNLKLLVYSNTSTKVLLEIMSLISLILTEAKILKSNLLALDESPYYSSTVHFLATHHSQLLLNKYNYQLITSSSSQRYTNYFL